MRCLGTCCGSRYGLARRAHTHTYICIILLPSFSRVAVARSDSRSRAASVVLAPRRRATRARRRKRKGMIVARRELAVGGRARCPAGCGCPWLPRRAVPLWNNAQALCRGGRKLSLPRRGCPVRSGAGSLVVACRRHETLPFSGIQPPGWILATPTKICSSGASTATRAAALPAPPRHAYSATVARHRLRRARAIGSRAGAPSIFGAGGFGR